jgi:hypothetical protein
MSQDKVVGLKRLLFRLFKSPKNLSLFFICCIGFLRGLWASLDPFSFKGDFDRLTDRMLYETVYSCLYGLYASVLLVWGGLYQGLKSKSSDPFKVLRLVIMAMMVLAFPVQLTISVLKGKRESPSIWEPMAIILVVTGVVVIFVGFSLFGILLYIYVERQSKQSSEPAYVLSPYRLSSEGITAREGQNRKMQNRLSIAPYRFKPQIQDEELPWEVSISVDEVAEKAKTCERFQFVEEDETRKKVEVAKEGNFILLITKEDRAIFRKLCILLFLSTILGILVLVLLTVLAKDTSMSYKSELALMYCSFTIELFACWMIYFVFTAQIKVKEKNYLRFFTAISVKMNHKVPKIKSQTSFQSIVSRLHKFYI